MQKHFFFFIIIFIGAPVFVLQSYGDSGTSAPVVTGHPMVTLNSQEMEKLIKDEEAVLRKIKIFHTRVNRHEHLKETQLAYQEALSLYRLQRPDQAKEVFSDVEYLTPYYKSSDAFLKNINEQMIQELVKKSATQNKVPGPQETINMLEKAKMLTQQAAMMGYDHSTIGVEEKLNKLSQSLNQLSNHAYYTQQAQAIAQEADKYEKEIFRLTQSGDYDAAQKEYLEFQQAMIDELITLKKKYAIQ